MKGDVLIAYRFGPFGQPEIGTMVIKDADFPIAPKNIEEVERRIEKDLTEKFGDPPNTFHIISFCRFEDEDVNYDK